MISKRLHHHITDSAILDPWLDEVHLSADSWHTMDGQSRVAPRMLRGELGNTGKTCKSRFTFPSDARQNS